MQRVERGTTLAHENYSTARIGGGGGRLRREER